MSTDMLRSVSMNTRAASMYGSDNESLNRPASSRSSISATEETLPPSVADPSVIIGMACRIPGATNPSQLWDNIAKKKDLQRKIPQDRFNVDAFYHPKGSNKGTTNARYGYFLDQGLDQFDAQFFNISGREAEAMDPQQRILLEVVYEALEDAGITLEEINGTQTAVYCGSFTNDYSEMTTKDLAQYPKYSITGTGNAILSNRISYYYNLHGPSMTLDTACSSSLVCFHLANKSVQSGESDMAIVAGSALHFDPNIFITMTDFGMLSVDGRCRSFDANGSGYVRGDGVCAVILKKQSLAEASRDSIRAIVRGTGANHDGLKEGLTVPNADAQARLLRQTYKDAGLSTADTYYFEAHGTGTAAGDPREAKAIGSVFGPARSHPLMIGSVKSNVGHLEGASGLAGIIKSTMSVEAGKILPNMHFNEPNSKIDFQGLKLQVPTELTEWKTPLRRASINSFGYGGSNAHVILENYASKLGLFSVVPQDRDRARRPFLLPLTSHSERGGKILAERLQGYLRANPQTVPSDLAYSYSTKRSLHAVRSFNIGRDSQSFLNDFLEPKPTQAWTRKLDGKPRVGFVFTGQGAQWYAMGRQLIEESPLFYQTLVRCDKILQGLPDKPGWSCITEMLKSSDESQLMRSGFSQPLCAALQLALVDVLASWAIRPSAVVGHSSGEIAAAYAAGILSFDSALICAYYRGLYMARGADNATGAMMAVGMSEAEGLSILKDYKGRISLAAINSPSSLTLSGDQDAIVQLKADLDERKVFARRLQVEQAFHSHHMVPLAPAFEKALSSSRGFGPRSAKCQMFSSVTARDSSAREMDASYWAANMTGMVRFSDALTGILLDDEDELNLDVLVEIGAHPALKGPSNQTMKSLDVKLPYIVSLSRHDPAFESLLACAGQLFGLGYPVDLVAVNSNHYLTYEGKMMQDTIGQRLKDLPTYSWDHRSYWAETRLIREHRQRRDRHGMLGALVPGGIPSNPRWRSYLRQNELPWLSQHCIDGKVIFPAAGYISMAIEAVSRLSSERGNIKLRDIVIQSALALSASEVGSEVTLDLQQQVEAGAKTTSRWYRFAVYSFDDSDTAVEHCYGYIAAGEHDTSLSANPSPFDSLLTGSDRSTPSAKFYERLHKIGLQYGNTFQLLKGDIESGPGFAVSQLSYDPSKVINAPEDGCVLHPTVLDASFHPIFAALETQLGHQLNDAHIPTFIKSLSVSSSLTQSRHQDVIRRLKVSAETKLLGARISVSDITISDETSAPIVKIKGLETTSLGLGLGSDQQRSLFFRIRWLDAFSALENGRRNMLALPELLDCFTHQYPDSRILHITPSAVATKHMLSKLSQSLSHRRKFQSIKVHSASDIASIEQVLHSELFGLVDTGNIGEKKYDLIVVEEISDLDISSLVIDGGYVICAGVELDTAHLKTVSETANLSIWTSQPELAQPTSHIGLLLSSNPSNDTLNLASSLEKLHPGGVCRVRLEEATNLDSKYGIISLLSLDEDVLYSQGSQSVHYNELQKLLSRRSGSVIWLLRGAFQESMNPAQALMLGTFRTVRNENEGIRLVSIDVPTTGSMDRTASYALKMLNRLMDEDELIITDDSLLIPRVEEDDTLNRKLPNGGWQLPALESSSSTRDIALTIGAPGHIDSLHFEERASETDLDDEEVEVEIKASVLSNRDLALSRGLIDGKDIGDQCAGVVVRAGLKSGFSSGDRVAVWGASLHGSVTRNPCSMTKAIGSLDFASAATVPYNLANAYYAVNLVANVVHGETCIVYSAATGIGQMVLQLMQRVGASVIATCSNDEQRSYLNKTYGLDKTRILLSDSTSWIDDIFALTGGVGCDVVINCSAEADGNQAPLDCVAPFGRIVEFSHTSLKPKSLSLGEGIVHVVVNMTKILQIRPSLASRILEESFKLVNDSEVKALLPGKSFSLAQVQEAFHELQLKDNFRQIVLVPTEESVLVAPPAYRDQSLFKPHKTYLIVGGLGGVGRNLAKWMFRRGARSLAFLSRSGASSASAKEVIRWLTERNTKIAIFEGDVSSQTTVNDCVQTIGSSLGGIFQAAMVLRDAFFSGMTLGQWRDCVDPKVQGTYNLHQATLDYKLDFFVSFSSFSALNGSMGQANYAAANTYIDALMRQRQSQGLPGFSMNVGMISGIGFVSQDSSLEKIMERNGWDPVSEEELYFQIEEAINFQSPASTRTSGYEQHQLITGVNMSRKDLFWAAKPMFRNLYANLDIGASSSQSVVSQDVRSMLALAKSQEERKTVMLEALTGKIATILSIDASIVQPGNSLLAYGLDSIVAADFRRWFSKSLSVDLALFDIIGSKSINYLVEKVTGMLGDSAIAEKDDESRNQSGNANSQGVSTATMESNALFNVARPNHIPMSTFQNRLWFLHNVVEDSATLNIGVTLLLDGTPKLEILEQALHELGMRNEIMRTSYFEGDEFSEQAIIPSFSAPIQTKDLSAETDTRCALEYYAKTLRSTPIDLEGGEAIRSVLAKLGDQQYAWVFAFHHVMLDNGGTKSFLDQLTGLYDAFRNGLNISQVHAPRISYVDFTLWHNRELESQEILHELAWWKKELSGTSGLSKLLPFAKNDRPAAPSRARRTLRSKIPATVVKKMKRACARLDATPFQFLLAALRAFIHRYTEEDDLTILMLDGNRPHSDIDDVLGFFVNIVPIRCQNSCEHTFDVLLSQISKIVLDSLAHSRAPFDKIVENVKTDAGSHFPLGQIVFNYQMYGKAPTYNVSDFNLSDIIIDDIPTACELSLEATEDRNSALDLRFEYDSYLYGAEDMDRFLENFGTFLTSSVKDFRQPIDEIYMCGPKEIQYLEKNCWVSELSSTSWGNQSIWDRFAEVAITQPDSIAIKTSSGESISYTALKDRARGISTALRDAGALPGDFVAILAYPGIDTIAAMIGAVRARCAYVPLDPTFASGRLEHIIQDSGASIILTDDINEALAGTISTKTSKVISLQSACTTPSHLQDNPYAPDDPVYVVYTSGSTGKPKGVAVSHGAIRAMLLGHNQVHKINQNDVMLAQISMSFDLSVTQIWGSLTSGATMALPLQDVRKDAIDLARFIADSETTITYFTPTHFALLLEENSLDLRLCHKLRATLFCGEHLPPRLVKGIYDLKTPATVYNEYGPSEATAQNTIHKALYPKESDVYVPIGYALPNSSLYVTDPNLRPVPASVSGELCIGGPQIALGYLNKPEATKKVFVKDEFVSGTFESQGWTKLYRTGDKAYFLANGEAHCRGRISGDKEIKLRGYRINQAEIENEIHATSRSNEDLALSEIAVIARHLNGDSKIMDERQIVAFIVPKTIAATDDVRSMITKIQESISHSLNEYMLPSGYQVMDCLPRLVSGKVDQVQLRNMELSLLHPISSVSTVVQDATQEADTLAVDELEQAFKTVLKLPTDRKVDPTENFFDLGGQSVLLLRLQASLNRKFGMKIPLIDLFENPTTAGMSQLISSKKQPGTKNAMDHAAPVWSVEASLPDDARYKPRPASLPPGKTDMTGILLIGAESFTGIHMLYSFLADTSANIHVLGSEKELQQSDLFNAFEQWSLFDSVVTRRTFISQVQYVQGSLAGTKFGLDAGSFTRLGENIQAIYHAGGHVSLLKSYTSLKHLNVQSVLDAIELASLGNTSTELHYVSTWSVPHLQSWNNANRTQSTITAQQQDPAHFQPGPGDNLGYFKTRWVAEMLMTEASRRGFPVYIYRTSGLSTSTRSKLPTPADNFTINFVLGMIETGKVPNTNAAGDGLPFAIDFAPIDYVASTISRLSLNAKAALGSPSIFHIGNTEPVTIDKFQELMAELRADRQKGTAVSVEDWTNAMLAQSKTEAEQMEWNMWKEYLDLGHTMFSLDRSATITALEAIEGESGVECPPIDVAFLKDMLERRKLQ